MLRQSSTANWIEFSTNQNLKSLAAKTFQITVALLEENRAARVAPLPHVPLFVHTHTDIIHTNATALTTKSLAESREPKNT